MKNKELNDSELEQVLGGIDPSSEAFEKQKEFLKGLIDNSLREDELPTEEPTETTTIGRSR